MHHVVGTCTRAITSAHPSLVSGADPAGLAAIAARFFQLMQDVPQPWSLTASTLLHPTSGSFLLPPGTHPCTLVSSISLKLDLSVRGPAPHTRHHAWTPGELGVGPRRILVVRDPPSPLSRAQLDFVRYPSPPG